MRKNELPWRVFRQGVCVQWFHYKDDAIHYANFSATTYPEQEVYVRNCVTGRYISIQEGDK